MPEPAQPVPEVPKTRIAITFFVAVGLSLLQWGLRLIGFNVNLYFGAFILAVAFGCMAYGFWISEKAAKWRLSIRVITIIMALVVYSFFIVRQIVTQYRLDHPPAVANTTLQESKPAEPLAKPQQQPRTPSAPTLQKRRPQAMPLQQENKPAAFVPTEVYMDCQMGVLPFTVPPHSSANLIPLNERHFGNLRSGFLEVVNRDDKDMVWPDLAKINSGGFNAGRVFYKCDISNHATTNLIDVVIPLAVKFGDGKTLIYSPIVSPLDAQTIFSFYMVNDCPISATLVRTANEKIEVQVFGEPNRRSVPLYRSHRSPMDKVRIFFPSTVNWTGNACE